jgi:hypothetical protein
MATTSITVQDGALDRGRLFQVFAKQAQVYGAFVLAYFVLLAALVVLLRQPARETSAEADLARAA